MNGNAETLCILVLLAPLLLLLCVVLNQGTHGPKIHTRAVVLILSRGHVWAGGVSPRDAKSG